MSKAYVIINQAKDLSLRVAAIAEDLPGPSLSELEAGLDAFEEILSEAEEVAAKADTEEDEDEDAA